MLVEKLESPMKKLHFDILEIYDILMGWNTETWTQILNCKSIKSSPLVPACADGMPACRVGDADRADRLTPSRQGRGSMMGYD